MNLQPKEVGWLEVICGSMFSGKTEELIRRLNRALIAKQKVQIFKPTLDDRYHEAAIVSHDDRRIESIPITRAEEILPLVEGTTQVVGIDEAQFFDDSIVRIAESLADRGMRVIIAGLDQDYLGQPFGPVPKLLAVAEYITKTLAICARCGNPANRSFRTSGARQQIEIGASEKYEARCRRCYNEGVE